MITASSTQQLELEIIKSNQESLYSRIDSIDNSVSSQYELISTLNDNLSNQISSVTLYVGVASLFLTIGGFAIAWYVNNILDRIVKTKDTVADYKRAIDENESSLFEKVARASLDRKLERLIVVPEDIIHIERELLSCELSSDDFVKLNRARTLKKLSDFLNLSYVNVLVQHFPYQSLSEDELYAIIVGDLNQLMKQMYVRDLQNFLVEALKFLSQYGVGHEKSSALLKAILLNLFNQDAEKKDCFRKFKINGALIGVTQEVLLAAVVDRPDVSDWVNL